jgi:hypothetical protein
VTDTATLPRRTAVLTCILAACTALLCAGMLTAAVLAPAPPLAVPFVVLAGTGLPIVAAWDLPPAVASLRGRPVPGSHAARVLAEFRRELDRLPTATGSRGEA